MGGQGLLLLMELKVLIMMTRPQNITRQAAVMFCGLVIIIKTFNSINSRRPWPPILISHLFQHGLFLNSWPQLFLHQGCFGWDKIITMQDTCIYIIYSNLVYMIVIVVTKSLHSLLFNVTYFSYACSKKPLRTMSGCHCMYE